MTSRPVRLSPSSGVRKKRRSLGLLARLLSGHLSARHPPDQQYTSAERVYVCPLSRRVITMSSARYGPVFSARVALSAGRDVGPT